MEAPDKRQEASMTRISTVWIFAIITASAPRTNSLSLQQAPQDYNGSNHVPTDTSSPLNYLKKYGKTHLEMMENRTLITKSCYCHVYARWHRVCGSSMESFYSHALNTCLKGSHSGTQSVYRSISLTLQRCSYSPSFAMKPCQILLFWKGFSKDSWGNELVSTPQHDSNLTTERVRKSTFKNVTHTCVVLV